MKNITVSKVDEQLQVVYGEVYAPDAPDSHGDYMTAEDIQAMAHDFIKEGMATSIDINHDNVTHGSVVVESFIAWIGNGVFIDGAWVVGVYVSDPEVWEMILNGELNGFSMQALVVVDDEETTEIEIPKTISGETFEEEGHTHTYTIRHDDEGNFLGGSTNTVEGHSHKILRGTSTLNSGDPVHKHKYSFLEDYTID